MPNPSRRSPLLVAGAAALGLAAVTAGILVAVLSGGGRASLLVPRAGAAGEDPLAFRGGDEKRLEAAAAEGLAHVLYAKSPGGIVAAAGRTAAFRPLVDDAARAGHVDADLLEAIVLLESAGRPEVIAGSDPSRAAGLTQIVAETAQNFLGMHVDLAASRRFTAGIAAAERRGDETAVERLRARRRQVDDRFDPARALAGTVRYLQTAQERFGRDDLATVSYHMGIGNLTSVIRDYSGDSATPVRDVVAREDISYARLYFDSSPVAHAAAWRRLARLGDDSETYYWRLLAAREVMHLYRTDRDRLERVAALQLRKASAEEVLHPAGETERFAGPEDVERARDRRVLQPLPADPEALHFKVDPQMGSLAPQLGQRPTLYRGLRKEALALLVYLARRVHALSGATAPLVVTSTVRDERYQDLLRATNPEATQAYSLHTTGYAIDILRRYESNAQAAAFQYELERLQARNLISWVREPSAIHITVSSDAGSLVPALLERAP